MPPENDLARPPIPWITLVSLEKARAALEDAPTESDPSGGLARLFLAQLVLMQEAEELRPGCEGRGRAFSEMSCCEPHSQLRQQLVGLKELLGSIFGPADHPVAGAGASSPGSPSWWWHHGFPSPWPVPLHFLENSDVPGDGYVTHRITLSKVVPYTEYFAQHGGPPSVFGKLYFAFLHCQVRIRAGEEDLTDQLRKLTETARALGAGMPELAGLEALSPDWWRALDYAWSDGAEIE